MYFPKETSTESKKSLQDNKTRESTSLPRLQIIIPDEQYTLQNFYKSIKKFEIKIQGANYFQLKNQRITFLQQLKLLLRPKFEDIFL